MYFRDSVHRHKIREYHAEQLVECFRHLEAWRPTTIVLASFGDLIDLTVADRLSMVQLLARASGVLDLVGLSSGELALGDADANARSIDSM